MLNKKNKLLIDSIKRLIRRGAVTHLRKMVNKVHAADLALVFNSLPLSNQKLLFEMIESLEQKGLLFGELEEDVFINLIEDLDLDLLAKIIDIMPKDDAADIIGRFPVEKSESILERMKQEGSEEVEDLLKYGNDTAGGIMVTDFIALCDDFTAKRAIESIQKEYLDVEMPFYLYVIDEYEKLAGVISLRQLVVVSPDTMLKKFMFTDVISVHTDVDQEEVAKIVARYDILAVPVVDESNRIVGIVTVDDVIDVFRQEATEDILKMAGVGDEFIETKSILRSTKIRLPWLFASCVGGLIAFFVIDYYVTKLNNFVYLVAFIPVIMGMGGNIGTQSSTIVVRGLATGRIAINDLWPIVLKELSVGCIIGIIYGVLIGVVAKVDFGNNVLAFSVGLSVVLSMSVATLIGSLVPMIFVRINVDPAIATGPFVTTAIDIASVFSYFQIASFLTGL